MPISREEFEQRRIDPALPVAGLLADYPDLAFTVEDIQQMLEEIKGRNATLEEVQQALDSLVARGRVEKAEIERQQWYTVARRRLGFLKE